MTAPTSGRGAQFRSYLCGPALTLAHYEFMSLTVQARKPEITRGQPAVTNQHEERFDGERDRTAKESTANRVRQLVNALASLE